MVWDTRAAYLVCQAGVEHLSTEEARRPGSIHCHFPLSLHCFKIELSWNLAQVSLKLAM